MILIWSSKPAQRAEPLVARARFQPFGDTLARHRPWRLPHFRRYRRASGEPDRWGFVGQLRRTDAVYFRRRARLHRLTGHAGTAVALQGRSLVSFRVSIMITTIHYPELEEELNRR